MAQDEKKVYKYPSKPQAVIYMDYEYLNEIRLNQSLEIRLNFNVGLNTESLQVKLGKTSKGLNVISSQTVFQFNKLSSGVTQSFIIQVIPEQPRLQALYISANILLDGHHHARSFVVPINVDGKENVPALRKSTDNKGMKYLPEKNIISMPAAESRE